MLKIPSAYSTNALKYGSESKMRTKQQSTDRKKEMCGESCTIHIFLYCRNRNAIYYIPHSVVRHNVEDEFGQLLGLSNVIYLLLFCHKTINVSRKQEKIELNK